MTPKLTLADCRMTAARGMETPRGVAWSGLVWVRDQPIAEAHNYGDGGCCVWRVRNREAYAEFEALAERTHPELTFEQADHLAGELWDEAYAP